MNAYLDIIGSILIAGTMMLSVFRLDAQMADRGLAASLALIAQSNGSTLARTLETDIRRLGFEVPEGQPKITETGPARLTFAGNVDLVGGAETVTYVLGGPNGDSRNPADSLLYRVVNGTDSLVVERGVTRFRLTYFDAVGAPTAVLAEAREIAVDFRVELPEAYRTWDEATGHFVESYPGSDFALRVRPKNL